MSITNKPDEGNTLLIISSIYDSLTKTEKRIADTILKNPEYVIYATVTDMADKTSSGETSVLRLCRKLGFQSYQAFKLSIAKELAHASKSSEEQDKPDHFRAFARRMTITNQSALDNTLALLDIEAVEQAVQLILLSRKITFFGVSASGNTALDGKYHFLRLGLHVDAVTDPHVMAMMASLMKQGDTVIAISTTGSTKDVVDAVEIAKNKGACLICLTSQARSPLAQHADAVLLISSRESPLQGGAFSSKLSQIHVLDILATALVERLSETTALAMEETAKAVADKLY